MDKDFVKLIGCFTGTNEAKFTKKLKSRGMQESVIEELLVIIKAHVCDVMSSATVTLN
jgi:hypothetical protein